MDLGISGRMAIVCGASKGLGFGCAQALAEAGVAVTIAARTEAEIDAAAAKIAAAGGTVQAVACDVTTPEGQAALLAVCPDPDILINNAGGPPPGDFRQWGREEWIAALDANMISAIELTKAVVEPMITRSFGRILNITSISVKEPIAVLGLSNGARAGLTGFMAGLARDLAPHGITINNLLPGAFDTDRLAAVHAAQAQVAGAEVPQVREMQAASIPARRFGTSEEFGAVCAFYCSAHAGYITAQNVLMDGGASHGVF